MCPHFSWRRMLTLPLAVRLQMCLTAGDELCFQRGDDGRKVEVVACVASAFSFDFLSSFAFCSRFHFLLPTRPYLYVDTHRFAALVFIFCSLLGLTYMFIHTGLLLSFSFSAPYSALPICSYTQVCCSRFHFLLPTRPYLYVHTHRFAALLSKCRELPTVCLYSSLLLK